MYKLHGRTACGQWGLWWIWSVRSAVNWGDEGPARCGLELSGMVTLALVKACAGCNGKEESVVLQKKAGIRMADCYKYGVWFTQYVQLYCSRVAYLWSNKKRKAWFPSHEQSWGCSIKTLLDNDALDWFLIVSPIKFLWEFTCKLSLHYKLLVRDGKWQLSILYFSWYIKMLSATALKYVIFAK